MATNLTSDTGVMGQTSQNITAVADALTTEFSNLMTDLEPLLTGWQGQGGSTFQTVRSNVDDQLGRLNVSLRSLAEAMGSQGTDYTVTDDELRTDMQRVGASEAAITTATLFNAD